MTGRTLTGDGPETRPDHWIRLDAGDAVELIDALEFFCDWFDYDHNRLDDRLFRYTGGGYDLAALRGDLVRLAERLGHAPLHTSEAQR